MKSIKPGVEKVQTRSWDAYDAYLIDIDGTLLHCRDAIHYYAFLDALRFLSGRPLGLSGVTTHGNTDVGILRDALTLAGIARELWIPHISDACTRMCSYVAARSAELRPQVLPGVVRMLQILRDRGAVLVVATGNLEGIGRMKLDRSALLNYFDAGAFSDGLEIRQEVFRRGVARVRAATGTCAHICAIGDTPADIRAARDCGIDVIAVATGVHSLQELARENPDRGLSSIEELFVSAPAVDGHIAPPLARTA